MSRKVKRGCDNARRGRKRLSVSRRKRSCGCGIRKRTRRRRIHRGGNIKSIQKLLDNAMSKSGGTRLNGGQGGGSRRRRRRTKRARRSMRGGEGEDENTLTVTNKMAEQSGMVKANTKGSAAQRATELNEAFETTRKAGFTFAGTPAAAADGDEEVDEEEAADEAKDE